jgi:pyrimidine-nucleoside phosphorylase
LRALDLIVKKRNGEELTQEEIRFLIEGYVAGDIPDYQVSSWLMAVFFRGMSRREAGFLTQEMIDSGETINLEGLAGPFVDKHSTGGVGDKVSLILAPAAAAGGLQVPMMSGRALGHTGGTLDKLESIPGYRTDLSQEQFRRVIGQVGYAMTGQSREVVPADRKLYGLRDVTGTVESVPLITASILSKKFAEGADALIFDVKCGAGAFMKTLDEARELASSLVETGTKLDKQVVAVISDMSEPLGHMVGNFLEVEEACACLGGSSTYGALETDARSADLMRVSTRLTAWMLVAGGKAQDADAAEQRVRELIDDGTAWQRFLANVEAQGGDPERLKERLGGFRAPVSRDITAVSDGTVSDIDAYKIGLAAVYLGAGRSKADDEVLPDVGVDIQKKVGSGVRAGEVLCTLYGHEEQVLAEAGDLAQQAYRVESDVDIPQKQMILDEIAAL